MRIVVFAASLALLLAPGTGPAQALAQDESSLLGPGEMAPDFELEGATRYGTLADPVRLSDYMGETVVLAFFFRVRTPG